MKFSLSMMALAVLAVPFAGCATPSLTSSEHINHLAHVADTNLNQVPEDVDRLLLLDHPSWLSKQPIPNR
jgi:hypothetical protein